MLISNVERQFSLRSLIYTHKRVFLFYPLEDAQCLQNMFYVEFLKFKLGKFKTFCTHNVVFVQQEEQDHAIVA